MRNYDENPDVGALLERLQPDGTYVWRWEGEDDVTLEEWQRAYESFEKFTYSATRTRLFDLFVVASKGVGVYRRQEQPEEALAVAEWALCDQQFQDSKAENYPQYNLVILDKASVLIQLNRNEEALSFFLDQAFDLNLTRRSRRLAYSMGIELIRELIPVKEDGETPIIPLALGFARDLFKKRYSKRKLPSPLLKENESHTYNWTQIHLALSPAQESTIKPSHNENLDLQELRTIYNIDGTDITLKQWELALESFKSFSYSSIEARLDDLVIIYLEGHKLFERLRDFEKMLALADWALHDEDLQQNHRCCIGDYCLVLNFKAEALLLLGRETEAMQFFLEKCAPLTGYKPSRLQILDTGRMIFVLLHRKEADWTTPALPEAIKFARDLFEVAHPGRKFPLPLREQDTSRTHSWQEIQRIVDKI